MSDNAPLRFEERSESLVRATYGHSIQAERTPPTYPVPQAHYFIYVRDTGDDLIIRRLWDPKIGDITQSESELLEIAKTNRPHPARIGNGFSSMSWQYPCYITIVLDNEIVFDWGRDDEEDPIIFLRTKNGIQYHPNHSFYNAQRVAIPTTDPGGQQVDRDAVRFENHIKADGQGTDLRHNEFRRYKFDLWVIKSGVPVQIDPDGQNQGPPDP